MPAGLGAAGLEEQEEDQVDVVGRSWGRGCEALGGSERPWL